MMQRLCLLAFNLCIICTLVACVEEQASTPVEQKPKAVSVAPAKATPVPEMETEEPPEEEKFEYDASSRRDPFVPLTQIRKPVATNDEEPLTPLQRYDVDQFRLLGIIIGKDAPKALVKSPDDKSYILSKGLKIGKNNGVIVDIDSEVILVEETYYDFSGNIRKNIQEIRVPKQ